MQIEPNQVAVVTGGASGIGLGLAHAFGQRGLGVVLADVEEAALAAAGAELTEAGTDVLPVRCDVTSLESVQALADTAFDWRGEVNVVCNNAGVVAFGGAFESLDDWRWVIDVDMGASSTGCTRSCRACSTRGGQATS
jgi:NAD(P)-dependent dehydrogenase (short-subunit alcohol dehydrogenase family)